MAEQITTAGTETKPEAEATGKEQVQIPKERLDQEIGKRRDVETRLEAAQRELEALKKGGAPSPAAPAQPPSDLSVVQQKLAAIEAREQRRELSAKLGLNDSQAGAVADLVAKGLSPDAALAAARVSNADLFSGQQQRGFDPSQHSSLRPTGNGMPAAPKLKEQLEAVAKLPTDQRSDAQAELLGKRLSKTLGWTRPDM